MFNIFKPKLRLKNAFCITPEFIREHSVMLLLLDIDKTLVGHGRDATPEVIDWINIIKNECADVKICIISNNARARVDRFNEKIKVDAVAKSGKPGKKIYHRLAEKYSIPFENIFAVGDQIFTDIWGANRAGAVSVYVPPLDDGSEEPFSIYIKRLLENLLFKIWGDSF